MAGAIPADIAAALKYGVKTQQAVRRSSYLSDALKSLNESGGKITGGYGELGAKLLAQAILQRSNNKAQDATLEALKADQGAETQSLLAGLRPTPITPPAAPTAPPSIALPPSPPQAQALPPAAAQPPPPITPASAPQLAPQDIDALTRMIHSEAGAEGETGMAAAAHVAMNRLKAGYGGGKSLRDIIFQPHQFEGIIGPNAKISPDDPAYHRAQQVAQAVIGGQIPDPTNGAMAFLNPELQAQLGRKQPAWAPEGQGQRIGRHVFYGGQQAAQGASMPQMGVTAEQVAASGAGSDPFPSAPGGSVPVAGGPAVASPPQASAAAASPQWPTWKPSPDEVTYVTGLLSDPRHHDEGVQLAMKWRQKMTEPVEATVQLINGVPFYVAKDPTSGAPVMAIPVPQEARTKVQSAQQAGIAAPPGVTFATDPLGNPKTVYEPQKGQMVTSAPGAPYAEKPITGGSNDPLAPAALFANEGKLRDDYEKQIQPYVIARQGYQKVIEAAKTGNPAGDIALVFGYMKTLDPGSTVREGEQAQVANSGTIPQTVTNIYNKLITGQGALSPAQRAQFADSARQQFGVYQQTADSLNERFGEISQRYGMSPENVIRKFDPIEPYSQPSDQRTPIPEAAKQAYQRRFQQGLIKPEAPMGSQQNPYQARDAATLKALDTPANRGKYVIAPDGSFGVID